MRAEYLAHEKAALFRGTDRWWAEGGRGWSACGRGDAQGQDQRTNILPVKEAVPRPAAGPGTGDEASEGRQALPFADDRRRIHPGETSY